MLLCDIMCTHVETTETNSSIRDAAWKMKELNIGMLPVVDGGLPVGVLTDRDIAVRLVAEGKDPNHTMVRDIMTYEHYWCYQDQEDVDAAAIMEQQQIRRLMVLDHAMRLVGVVSLSDFATCPGEEKLAFEVLHEVSEPLSYGQ